MLYANGIGPLKMPKNRLRAAKVLNKIDMITLRDSDSLEVLSEIGATEPPALVTADAAFGIKNTEQFKGKELLKLLGLENKPFFCISVRSWEILPKNFEEQMANYADKMSVEYGYSALFTSMQPQKDTAITKRIMALMKQPSYFTGEVLSVNTILGICQEAQFMVAMRLHAAIYAIKCAKPVIGLIYDPKIKGVLSDFGQRYLIDVENAEAERLMEFSQEIIENSAAISQGLAEKNMIVEKLAAKNVELAYKLIKNEVLAGDYDE